MSRTNDIVTYGGAGIGITIFLYVIFGFAPSLMVSLSIADTLGRWSYTERKHVPIPESFKDPESFWYKGMKEMEDPPGSGMYYSTDEKEGWAGLIWGCSFGVLIAIQMALQANIRQTWLVVIIWWLLSIYPFCMWFFWFYSDFGEVPFPGIDWMPW